MLIKPDLIEHVVEPILPKDLYEGRHARGAHAGQPDRPFRAGRAHGRHRPHRPQAGGRHLRRRRASRRRRLLGQRPEQGRPLGRLRGPLRRQEPRGRRPRRGLRGADRLRHRGRAPGVGHDRLPRHRDASRWSPSRLSCASTSTCARRRSSATSTCGGRSTARPRPTAISAAPITTSPGSAPTRRRRCARPPASGLGRAGRRLARRVSCERRPARSARHAAPPGRRSAARVVGDGPAAAARSPGGRRVGPTPAAFRRGRLCGPGGALHWRR